MKTKIKCLASVLFFITCCHKPAENKTENGLPKETLGNEIRFGISPFQDTLLPILGDAAHKNWYSQEGLNVTFKILGWTEVQESLASGAIDIGVNNISSIVATHNKSPNLIYLYGVNVFDNGFALMVRPDGSIKTLADVLKTTKDKALAIRIVAEQLKGKTVITTRDTDMEQGVAAAARRGNIQFSRDSNSDVKIIDLPPDEGLAAFLTGQGDAYIGGIPQRTKATKGGMVEMLTGADLGPPPINGFVTTKEFYHTHKQELAKILKVWFKIVNYVQQNPDEGGAQIVKVLNDNGGTNFDVQDFKKFWQKYETYPLSPKEAQQRILSPNGDSYWQTRWQDCNHFFAHISKVIPAEVDPSGVFMMEEFNAYFISQYGSDLPGSVDPSSPVIK